MAYTYSSILTLIYRNDQPRRIIAVVTPCRLYVIRPDIENKTVELVMDFLLESRLWGLVALCSPATKFLTQLLYHHFIFNDLEMGETDLKSFVTNYRPIAGILFRIYVTAFRNYMKQRLCFVFQ